MYHNIYRLFYDSERPVLYEYCILKDLHAQPAYKIDQYNLGIPRISLKYLK